MPFRSAGFAVNVGFEKLAIHPPLNVIVRDDVRQYGHRREFSFSLVFEEDFASGRFPADEPAIVNKVMMVPAKHDQIVHARFTVISPVLYVVTVDKSGVRTARKAASFVSCTQCTAHWWWNGP